MRWQLIICVLSVLVTMWGSSAMAEEATLLTPGTIEIGFTMANKMAHYKVDLTGQTKVLTVFATSIGDGDPDILAGFTNPVTESNAQFVGLNKDADSITLSHDMYKDKTTLYISILGFTSSTEFSVVASFESVITLENGVPLSGDVPKEGTDYFTFLAPSIDHDVTFSIVSTTGSAVLMVSAEDGIDHHDISTYDYITSVGQASDSIAAHKSDKDKYPPTGKFYLAIYGDSDATYTITASTSSKSVRLRAGVPHVDHVEEKKYEYFTIKISNPGCDLKVDVTPLSGDPDVFMSATNEKPSKCGDM